MEYILCAAIWFDDGKKYPHVNYDKETGFVLAGMRHSNCISNLVVFNKRMADYAGKYTQGFITNKNRFVDRKEAAIIAFKANQIKKESKTLFSEDLY